MELSVPERARAAQLARKGPLADPATFTEMVRSRLSGMVRLAARIAPHASPEDIVQEALLRAWRYREKYDPRRGPVSGWLMGIVVHEARRAARRRPMPIAAPAPGDPFSIEDREDLDAAVRRLPPRQRLAVDCFYYVDLSIAETAAAMECSEGTVKSTLADARARLRAIVTGDDAR